MSLFLYEILPVLPLINDGCVISLISYLIPKALNRESNICFILYARSVLCWPFFNPISIPKTLASFERAIAP